MTEFQRLNFNKRLLKELRTGTSHQSSDCCR
jgi:hypothetical protein